MRKFLAILLLTVFGLPLATPLFAATQSGEGRLPACCRRDGAHHCAMRVGTTGSAKADPGQSPAFSSAVKKCPYSPASSVAGHRDVASPRAAESLLVASECVACEASQTKSMWRTARERSRCKRGPPAADLAQSFPS